MNKICFVIALVCLLITGHTQQIYEEQFLTTTPVPSAREITVSVWWYWNGNLFDVVFEGKPWEILLMVFNNGDIATLTGYFEGEVPVGAAYFAYMCKYYGKEVSEIALLVHNHLWPGSFSPGDKKFYENLKEYGFQGEYILYSPGKKIRKYLGDHKAISLKSPWKKEKEKNETKN